MSENNSYNSLSASSVPGAVLNPLHVLPYLIPTTAL